jgi:hypothetical protein
LFGDRRRHPARVTRSLFPHLLAAIFRCIALPPRGDTEANRKQTPILRKRPSTNVWNVEEVEETPEKLFDDALKNIGYSRITNDGRTTMIEEMVPKKKKKTVAEEVEKEISRRTGTAGSYGCLVASPGREVRVKNLDVLTRCGVLAVSVRATCRFLWYKIALALPETYCDERNSRRTYQD